LLFGSFWEKNPPKKGISSERKIDQLVYEFYSLSEEEIKIVENAVAEK
jgi:hypothetical protein